MFPEHNLGVTEWLFDELPVVGKVAIVKDQHDTAILEGISPERFLAHEVELLETAYEIMPRSHSTTWT